MKIKGMKVDVRKQNIRNVLESECMKAEYQECFEKEIWKYECDQENPSVI